MVFDNLEDSYNNDEKARGEMHIAQCLAGMAFSNALLGITHSLAHKIGAQYDISHGCCNAILLPYVIKYNTQTCEKSYTDIARHLNLPGATDKQLVASLIQAVAALNAKMNIPTSFKASGVAEEVFTSTLDFVAQSAALDPCTSSNPRTTTAVEMKKILECAYYGRPVNF